MPPTSELMTLRLCRPERFALVQMERQLADTLELGMLVGTVVTVEAEKTLGTEATVTGNSLGRRLSRRIARHVAYFAGSSGPKG